MPSANRITFTDNIGQYQRADNVQSDSEPTLSDKKIFFTEMNFEIAK